MNFSVSSVFWFFPAHNEEGNLVPLIEEALDVFRMMGLPFKLAVINDGSTDSTQEVAEMLQFAYPDEVMVINHSANLGYSAALKTGFEAGLRSGLSWIGFCDADRQFRIETVISFIEVAGSGDHDIVIGYRQNRADGLIRLMTGRGWHWFNWVVLGLRAEDVDCGFKLFRREVINELLSKLIGDHATISPEILVRARRRAFSIHQMGIEHLPRRCGKQTGVDLRTIIGSFKSLRKVRRDVRKDVSFDKNIHIKPMGNEMTI
jgi:glycosyltransferase involved in cell wall biosynthesis